MLRILVISLFVANLLLLGFQSSKPAAAPEPKSIRSEVRDPGIPTIHLFSEIIEDQNLMSGNRRCFSLGPFHSSEDKDNIQLLLQEVSTRISERQTEALVEKGYWVFMPPYASLLEANQALISLQSLGLEDIGIIFDGDWKNAVSLGYFMRQENAIRRKKSLEERGYVPLMRVQRQSESRYWLDYEQTPGSGLIALDMQNRPNDFMQRSVPCPEQEPPEVAEAEPRDAGENLAQLQPPAGEDDLVAGQVEDAVPSESIESTQEDPLEDLPGQAGDDAPEAVVEDSAEQVAEVDLPQAVEDQPAQTAGTDPQELAEDQATQTAGTDPQDNVENQPAQTVGTGPEDGIEDNEEPSNSTEPDGDVEDGTGEG